MKPKLKVNDIIYWPDNKTLAQITIVDTKNKYYSYKFIFHESQHTIGTICSFDIKTIDYLVNGTQNGLRIQAIDYNKFWTKFNES